MQIEPTDFNGVFTAHAPPAVDERGSFTRLWCRNAFSQHAEQHEAAQVNLAVTTKRGTVRGLHFQAGDDWEAKYIRCLRGSAVVVAIDLRRDSATFLQHFQLRLEPKSDLGVHVPVGFAQGYQTLSVDTEILYIMSRPYQPDAARGYRYDDPRFAIRWPLPPVGISTRDQNWPAYSD